MNFERFHSAASDSKTNVGGWSPSGVECVVPLVKERSGALVEDAAIELTVDGRLDAATQVAVGVAEALLVHLEAVLKVMSESPVEDRPLGTAWAIDVCT